MNLFRSVTAFSAWIWNLHWQRCTPAAGSNKRTTSSFTAAALLFSSKYQPSFEFTPHRCSLMYYATRCQVKSQHSLGFVRYLRLPLLLDDCAMLGPDATCCWEEDRGNRLNAITANPKKQDFKKEKYSLTNIITLWVFKGSEQRIKCSRNCKDAAKKSANKVVTPWNNQLWMIYTLHWIHTQSNA